MMTKHTLMTIAGILWRIMLDREEEICANSFRNPIQPRLHGERTGKTGRAVNTADKTEATFPQSSFVCSATVEGHWGHTRGDSSLWGVWAQIHRGSLQPVLILIQ